MPGDGAPWIGPKGEAPDGAVARSAGRQRRSRSRSPKAASVSSPAAVGGQVGIPRRVSAAVRTSRASSGVAGAASASNPSASGAAGSDQCAGRGQPGSVTGPIRHAAPAIAERDGAGTRRIRDCAVDRCRAGQRGLGTPRA